MEWEDGKINQLKDKVKIETIQTILYIFYFLFNKINI